MAQAKDDPIKTATQTAIKSVESAFLAIEHLNTSSDPHTKAIAAATLEVAIETAQKNTNVDQFAVTNAIREKYGDKAGDFVGRAMNDLTGPYTTSNPRMLGAIAGVAGDFVKAKHSDWTVEDDPTKKMGDQLVYGGQKVSEVSAQALANAVTEIKKQRQ